MCYITKQEGYINLKSTFSIQSVIYNRNRPVFISDLGLSSKQHSQELFRELLLFLQQQHCRVQLGKYFREEQQNDFSN